MKLIAQTKQQRYNTLDALHVMWPSVPPENVYPGLEDWRKFEGVTPPDCGTVCCFGGWCAWWPPFNKQGVQADPDGCCYPTTQDNGNALKASTLLFGNPFMFEPVGCHFADVYFAGTDHELVTHRLQWLLENSEVQP